jgi:hypothetical protein
MTGGTTGGAAGVQAGDAALHSRHRPPRDCPVCGNELDVTELGCPGCGSRLSGSFASCRFCALSAADAEVVEVFLRSRGNMREVERHLGVSYPTARQRFTELLARLGLAELETAEPEADPGTPAGGPSGESSVPDPSERAGSGGESPSRATVRQQVLSRLAAGDLTPEQAAVILRGR